jgi:hypothetical protein
MTTELIQLTNQPKPVVVVTASAEPTAGSGTSETRVVAPRRPSKHSKATTAFKKRKLQGLLGSIWDAVQETIEIENQS